MYIKKLRFCFSIFPRAKPHNIGIINGIAFIGGIRHLPSIEARPAEVILPRVVTTDPPHGYVRVGVISKGYDLILTHITIHRHIQQNRRKRSVRAYAKVCCRKLLRPGGVTDGSDVNLLAPDLLFTLYVGVTRKKRKSEK